MRGPWGGPEDQVCTVRLDSRDFALEELGGVGLADEVHQDARNGHDDGCEVESPAPVRRVRNLPRALHGRTEYTS